MYRARLLAVRLFLQQRYYNSLMLPALAQASEPLKLGATMRAELRF